MSLCQNITNQNSKQKKAAQNTFVWKSCSQNVDEINWHLEENTSNDRVHHQTRNDNWKIYTVFPRYIQSHLKKIKNNAGLFKFEFKQVCMILGQE